MQPQNGNTSAPVKSPSSYRGGATFVWVKTAEEILARAVRKTARDFRRGTLLTAVAMHAEDVAHALELREHA